MTSPKLHFGDIRAGRIAPGDILVYQRAPRCRYHLWKVLSSRRFNDGRWVEMETEHEKTGQRRIEKRHADDRLLGLFQYREPKRKPTP